MDIKFFFTVFGSVFLAEMADKTQMATMLFAADNNHARLTVFVASAMALTATSALGVPAGGGAMAQSQISGVVCRQRVCPDRRVDADQSLT